MNYILYGEQYPMIKKDLNKLLKERLGDPDDFNVVKFDMNECDVQEILDESETIPLGYDKKAIVVDKCTFLMTNGSKEIKEKFVKILEKTSDDIDIILIHRGGSIDKNSEIAKIVQESGEIREFMDLKPNEWPLYIRKYFNKLGITIDAAAVDELSMRVDGDLNRFIQEAEKLSLYKDHITLIDVTTMVAKPLEDDVFQISNALLRGDNAVALGVFRDLNLVGSRVVETLIPMLASSFRFISQVLFLSHNGLDNGQIASQLGCKEGRVAVSLRNTRKLSKGQIDRIIDDLYHLDNQIKSGLIDRFYGFELFLINFPN